VVDEGGCLCLYLRKGKFNQVWYKRTDTTPPPPPPAAGDATSVDSAARWGFTKLIDNYDAKWELITTEKREWLFFTNSGAPRYRIVAIDLDNPSPENWREVVPESEHTLGGGDYAHGGHCVDGKLILKYMNHVKDELHQYALDGTFECKIPLPELGVISAIHGERGHADLFFRFESFLTPPVIYRYIPSTQQLKVVLKTEIQGLDTSEYVIEQQFVRSKDGTDVPMFIVRPRELLFDGMSGAVLFGYGGFNVVKSITFDPLSLTLLQLLSMDGIEPGFWRAASTGNKTIVRGIYAIANIRGGGEYGRDWHAGGCKGEKQNTFDDFIACSEWLIENKYTSPKKLCISGASNGGLLVTAVANQRPELFAGVLCQVGLLDMLRFHKFTIGHFWTSDYGSPDDAADFKIIKKYSPYHNVQGGKSYPAMLFTTADHDDRVVPLHTLKTVAQLQHVVGRNPSQLSPILVRVETKAGHGSGTATSKRLSQTADLYVFVLHALGIKIAEGQRRK